MTVSYTDKVATCRGFGNFYKLLFRWKGSIYKVIWVELLVYLICFYAINCFYRFYLLADCDKKRFFIEMVRYCDNYGKDIPVSFVLGFYVNIVVTRWWDQFMLLPWPDTLALTVSMCVDGSDDRGRLIRRTIMRYTNLSYVMAIKMMSPAGNLRFPTMVHLCEAGFMLDHERLVLDELNSKTTYPKYWAPIVWGGVVARKARKEGKIKDDISLNNVINAMNNFRQGLQRMLTYDWVNVPLVYTQVVTLAVYLYFLAALLGKQLIVATMEEEPLDIYFPVFTFLEFFFYFGWLKVAECLINPFGEDDDDFEVNWMIDRYFQVSYVIVDEMHQEHPNLLKDQYWDEVFPLELPYTEAAAKYKTGEGQTGSAKNIEVTDTKAEFVKPEADLKYIPSGTSLATGVQKEDSADSLTNAMKKMNERRRKPAGGLESTDTKKKASLDMEDDNILLQGVSSMGSIGDQPPRLRNQRGSTGNTTRGIDVKMLMEQDDVLYDAEQDRKDKKGKDGEAK